MKILKIDEEQRLVSGLGMVCVRADGKPVVDLQNDSVDPTEFERAWIEYSEESRVGDVMHNQQPASTLVEMVVVSRSKLDAILKAFGADVDLGDFAGVAAWVTYRVHDDEAWRAVKAGTLKGFSIEASAARREA